MTSTILRFHTKSEARLSPFRRVERDITSLDDWRRNRLHKFQHPSEIKIDHANGGITNDRVQHSMALSARLARPLPGGTVGFVIQGDDQSTLIFRDDTLRIRTTGFFGTNEKTFFLSSIAAVSVTKGIGAGSIQFSIAVSHRTFQGAFEPVMHDDSFLFRGDDRYEIALTIKYYIEKRLRHLAVRCP
jgi:hypothetical protein